MRELRHTSLACSNEWRLHKISATGEVLARWPSPAEFSEHHVHALLVDPTGQQLMVRSSMSDQQKTKYWELSYVLFILDSSTGLLLYKIR